MTALTVGRSAGSGTTRSFPFESDCVSWLNDREEGSMGMWSRAAACRSATGSSCWDVASSSLQSMSELLVVMGVGRWRTR